MNKLMVINSRNGELAYPLPLQHELRSWTFDSAMVFKVCSVPVNALPGLVMYMRFKLFHLCGAMVKFKRAIM